MHGSFLKNSKIPYTLVLLRKLHENDARARARKMIGLLN